MALLVDSAGGGEWPQLLGGGRSDTDLDLGPHEPSTGLHREHCPLFAEPDADLDAVLLGEIALAQP